MSTTETTRRKAGRPVTVRAEVDFGVRGPESLRDAVRDAAEAEGVSVAEWVRRAMRERLGWQDA